jgi:thymidylate synthase
MHCFKEKTFLDMGIVLAEFLQSDGKKVSTDRTGEFLELQDVVYSVEDSTSRLLPIGQFGQSRLWAYNEVMTEFLGLNPPLTEYYTNADTKKMMEKFHRGDGRANYTYGERWHNNQAFQHVLQTLQKDRYSRQAVMNIWDSSIDLNGSETNIPCTIMHQFMIRSRSVKLPAILNIGPATGIEDVLTTNVYLRSNDFFRGWKYDIFLNSFIHEAFAGMLHCVPGNINFHIGSFHVYKADYEKLDLLLKRQDWDKPQQQPRFVLSFGELYNQLWVLYDIQNESRFREFDIEDVSSGLAPIFQIWAKAYAKHNRCAMGSIRKV